MSRFPQFFLSFPGAALPPFTLCPCLFECYQPPTWWQVIKKFWWIISVPQTRYPTQNNIYTFKQTVIHKQFLVIKLGQAPSSLSSPFLPFPFNSDTFPGTTLINNHCKFCVLIFIAASLTYSQHSGNKLNHKVVSVLLSTCLPGLNLSLLV